LKLGELRFEVGDIMRNMKKKKGIIIVIIVIALLLGVYFYYVAPVGGYFIDQNEFGQWGQQFLVDYADGSHENLAIVSQEQRLSVSHQGIPIVSLTYKLSARATGTGYQNINIDYTIFTVTFAASTNSVVRNPGSGQPILNIPVDGQWHEICVSTVSDTTIQGSLAPGTYQMTIAGGGTMKYKGDNDISYEDASIPGSITFEITITQQFALIVEFSNDISYDSGTQQQPEDFTTFTESDPSNYLVVSPSSTITFTSMPRTATCYLQKQKVMGTGTFSVSFDMIITQLETNPGLSSVGGTADMMFTKYITTTTQKKSTTAVDGLFFSVREYTSAGGLVSYNAALTSGSGGTANTPISLNTLYSVLVSRTAGGSAALTVKQGGTLIYTGGIVDHTDVNYFIGACGRGESTGTWAASGTFSNVVFSLY
jgi:hypothetical protein